MPRNPRHAALVAAAIVALALLASACGSSPLSRKDYEQRVDRIGAHAQSQLGGVVDGNSPPTAKQMRRAGSVFQQAAKDLDAIDPPHGVARPHRQLVDGFRLLALSFAHYADDLAKASSDGERAQVFVTFADDRKVRRAFTDLTSAQREFRAAGYAKVLGPDDGGATARGGTAATAK